MNTTWRLSLVGVALLLLAPPATSAPRRARDYQPLVDEVAGKLGGLARRKLSFRPEVVLDAAASGLSQAEAFRHWNAAGKHIGCTIHIYPLGQAHALDSRELRSAIAHEVWHCFQSDRLDKDAYAARPLWIIEGEAMWVGESFVNGAPALETTQRRWREYVTDPAKSLFTRKHDAIGFFSHLTDAKIDVWTILDPVLDAGADNAKAFGIATGGKGSTIASWGASYFLDTTVPEFDMVSSPGRDKSEKPPAPKELTLGDGSTGTLTTPPVTVAQGELHVTTDVLRVQMAGYGAVGDATSKKSFLLEGETRSFCVKAACKCPDGTLPIEDLVPLSANAHLAVAGSPGTASTATVTALSIDKLCKERWHGIWKSSKYKINGTFELSYTKSKIQMNGDVTITGSDCVKAGGVLGAIESNGSVKFGTVASGPGVTWTGTITKQAMSGKYTSPGCGNDLGVWSATPVKRRPL